ncbi:collagenase [Roseateles sp.]|uniref:collagenase n=1 Tax=Roseateles sp. TaxID=1971397 RepID=UPI003BAC9731
MPALPSISAGLLAAAALLLSACSSVSPTSSSTPAPVAGSVDQILNRSHRCSDSLSLRSQALNTSQEAAICSELALVEQRFHSVFKTLGRPVKGDLNHSLRASIYASNEDFSRYAGQHFNMPIDNGGMYLEGLPDQPGNQAEFIANQRKDGSVRNLAHEYVHYLDGRFNLHGDFCAVLHDSHSPPENCARPAPLTPYLVWWTEGVAEYIAHGDKLSARQREAATAKTFALSQLFDTGYEANTGEARVYSWGYLAVRFMMERHRTEIEQMLSLTRVGDYPRYQALVKQWDSSFDAEFAAWLTELLARPV